MARKTKSEKRERAEGAIDGIRRYFGGRGGIPILGETYTSDELIALIEEHLRALAEVDDLTVRKSIAVAKERAVLARVGPILSALKSLVSSEFEETAPELREFGFAPKKKPVMTVETKRLANEKRQATRKERGIMGRKERARSKTGK